MARAGREGRAVRGGAGRGRAVRGGVQTGWGCTDSLENSVNGGRKLGYDPHCTVGIVTCFLPNGHF